MRNAGSETKYLVMIAIGLLLASCSDESFNEALNSPAYVHLDKSVIAATSKIDVLLEEQSRNGNWAAKVFETETELLAGKEKQPAGTNSVGLDTSKERKAYFGDLHVHTTYSFDGYAFGTLATPYDAYRFAKGEAIAHPAGFNMQLSRPMDFYAVTDHGMFLGLVKAAADTTTEFSENEFSEPYHNLNSPENSVAGLFSILKRLSTFSTFLPSAVEQIISGQLDRNEVLGVVRSAWKIRLMPQTSLMIPVTSLHLQLTNILPVLRIWATCTETLYLREQINCLASLFLAFIRSTLKTFGNGWTS